jgi:hypothetical protein
MTELLRRLWVRINAERRQAGVLAAILVLGMLLWARIIVISNVPRMAVADPAEKSGAESKEAAQGSENARSHNRSQPKVRIELADSPDRDPFVISPRHFPRPIIEGDLPPEAGKSDAQQAEDPVQTETRQVARLRALVGTLKLEAVMRGTPVAVLNGTKYQLGQMVSVAGEKEIRFTLVEVRSRSVILGYRDYRFELEMASPDFK